MSIIQSNITRLARDTFALPVAADPAVAAKGGQHVSVSDVPRRSYDFRYGSAGFRRVAGVLVAKAVRAEAVEVGGVVSGVDDFADRFSAL